MFSPSGAQRPAAAVRVSDQEVPSSGHVTAVDTAGSHTVRHAHAHSADVFSRHGDMKSGVAVIASPRASGENICTPQCGEHTSAGFLPLNRHTHVSISHLWFVFFVLSRKLWRSSASGPARLPAAARWRSPSPGRCWT